MKATHKIKQLQDCKKLLRIDVPKGEIAIAYQEVYRQIQKDAALPGFRKGKAPMDLLKKNYKQHADKMVVEYLIEDSYKGAMKEAGLLPVGIPKIENAGFNKEGNFTFDATVEIRPNVNVKDYKSLKIKKKSMQVKDEEIDRAIENLRQLGARYKAIPARPVMEGDFILCDLEWLVEGKSIEKQEKVVLNVLKKEMLPDIYGGILGINVNEKRSLSVNIGKDFHKPQYIGKAGILEIMVHQLEEKELPALDDNFAKDLGPFENIAALRQKMKENLLAQKQQSAQMDMEEQAIKQLLEANAFALPKSLVESELKNLKAGAKQKLISQGYGPKEADDCLQNESGDLCKGLRQHAESQVRAFFILEDIAIKENLQAASDEVDKLIEALAVKYKKSTQDFKKQPEAEAKIDGFYWQLTEAKVVEFLLKNARIQQEPDAENMGS